MHCFEVHLKNMSTISVALCFDWFSVSVNGKVKLTKLAFQTKGRLCQRRVIVN